MGKLSRQRGYGETRSRIYTQMRRGELIDLAGDFFSYK
jgi:hypothetical protein